MIRRLLVLLLLAVLCRTGSAGEAEARAAIMKLLGQRGPAAGTFGVHVSDCATGKPIFAADADTPRIPASTMKVVTTVTAFDGQGVFLTRVTSAAEPSPDGTLAGDLVVRGRGDPTLTAGDLDDLAVRLARAGVRRVAGDLVLDDGWFDRELRHPSWPKDQRLRRYCAAVGALNVDRNCVRVVIRPGPEAGSPATALLRPATRVFRLENLLTTTAKKAEHKVGFYALPGDRVIQVKGKVWVKSTDYEPELAVSDPTTFFGDVFRSSLVKAGISVAGEVRRGPGAEEHTSLAAKETPVLAVIRVTNKESQNLYADCLLKNLGPPSFAGGAQFTADRARELAGLPEAAFRQVDGSGLSRENRVAPRILTAFLDIVFATDEPLRYLETLASGGEKDSTLEKRLSDLGGNVRAKTGTIRAVSALAGYVRTKSGRVVSFAFLVNDPRTSIAKSRTLQDEVCRILHREL